MKRQRKTLAGIIILMATLLIMPLDTLAGNLEPSAPPTTGTMRTLDDIYNKTNNASALPKPEEVTIISKAKVVSGITTLYTVTSGKTFYLMGVAANWDSNGIIEISSVDGTNTTIVLNFYLTLNYTFNVTSPYPIASFPSGSDVRTKGTACVNIWGYEK